MEIAEIILGIVLMVLAVALTACVLLQSGKEKKLSSAITGSSDTFFSKGKGGQTKDKLLSRITTVLAVVFCLLAFAAVIVITVIV